MRTQGGLFVKRGNCDSEAERLWLIAFAGFEMLQLCLHDARIVDERTFWMVSLITLGLVSRGIVVRSFPACKVSFGALPSLMSRAQRAETFDAVRR
jgi:hypothetical protein